MSLSALLAPFGPVDDASIALLLKPAPPKKPKRVVALVPFKQIGGAFAAVCASGRKESGLDAIEVGWAEGKEPELIGWLKKMGQLGGQTKTTHTTDGGGDLPRTTPGEQKSVSGMSEASSPSNRDFSSFPYAFL